MFYDISRGAVLFCTLLVFCCLFSMFLNVFDHSQIDLLKMKQKQHCMDPAPAGGQANSQQIRVMLVTSEETIIVYDSGCEEAIV